MKIVATLTACMAVVIAIILPCQAQTSAPATKRTVWVEPPTGSLLGRGVVNAGGNDVARPSAAAISAAEKPSFKTALNDLDAQSATVVEGYSLIGPAVSWQTGVPVETVKKQRAATGLSFGDLLVANSLASGSGKSFNEIMRIKAKTQGWSELAKQLNINIDSVTARLRTAGESLKYADSRRNKRREENIRRQMDQIQNNGKITPEMMPAPVSPLAPHHP
jgi:gas vesicle protein